jgi:exodeoxyribonuclease VII small subunit
MLKNEFKKMPTKAKKNYTYTEALQRIENILGLLESGETDIDQLSDLVKEASALLKQCKTQLRSTQEDLEKNLDDLDQEEV